MSNYTRSRAKMYRDEPADGGGYYRQRGSGNGRGYALFIGGVIVVVVLVIAIVFMFKSCSEGASTLPEVSPSDMGVWTPTPTESPTPAPTDAAGATDAAGTATADASATAGEGATSTPEATASPTAELSATATPEPTSGSSSGGDDKSPITPAEIKGKPDVNEYLPLRKSAYSTAEELAKIQKDEEFTILQVSTNKSWLKVKYNDKTGYVLAKYVTVGSGDSDKVCTVATDTLNVRGEAGKTKSIIGTLKSGDTVIVTDTVTVSGEKWYKIDAGDKKGYIFATNCRLGS